MSYVEGKKVLLEAKKIISGTPTYVPFACSTSLEFYYDTELIEKATVGLGGFRGYVSGFGEWGVRLNTVTYVVGANNAYTVFDTLLDSLRKNGLNIRLTFEDNDANLKVITGHAMIPHTGITSPEDGFSEDDIELKGDGAFALSTTLVTPPSTGGDIMEIDYTSTSGGEDQLTFSDLIGRNILLLMRDGIGQEEISLGDPNDKQFYFNSSTGTIYFYNPNSVLSIHKYLRAGEWVHILYQ